MDLLYRGVQGIGKRASEQLCGCVFFFGASKGKVMSGGGESHLGMR